MQAMLNFNTRTVHGLFLDTIADAQAAGKQTALFAPFIYKMHYFTKTGSGRS
jgi:hypothetical protein